MILLIVKVIGIGIVFVKSEHEFDYSNLFILLFLFLLLFDADVGKGKGGLDDPLFLIGVYIFAVFDRFDALDYPNLSFIFLIFFNTLLLLSY